jgi:hypothetical protein
LTGLGVAAEEAKFENAAYSQADIDKAIDEATAWANR